MALKCKFHLHPVLPMMVCRG